jgi:hypothetical protein
VTVNSTSASNATAFQTGTNVVRLFPTVNMHIKFGQSPTATTSEAKIAPGVEYFYCVNPGEKIAAIRTTTSGSLYVTEVS